MYSKYCLSFNEAKVGIEAALLEAQKDPSHPIAIAIVDPTGDLIYFVRQDNSRPMASMLAINKAYTSIRFCRDTKDLAERFKGLGIKAFPDPKLTPIPGGICIKEPDGTCIGGIGISGF